MLAATNMNRASDESFCRALPKVELHAHLTGSISRKTLRLIWRSKKAANPQLPLEDPFIAIPPAAEGVNVSTFFPLFDKYIYNLITTRADVRLATLSVLQDFAADGVVYLELRTTPRDIPSSDITKQDYISIVLETIDRFNKDQASLYCNLILSIDRRNTLPEANNVVELAARYKAQGVVGIDICGNPMSGDVSIFKPAFARARSQGLHVTVHFAEVAQSDATELQTMLDFQPDRLGHVIHVPESLKKTIQQRRIGLELCLSCNVLAKLTEGGFVDHHFGQWRHSQCPIALSTDDVGIFESPLSNEYALAMSHFGLSRRDTISLSRSAASCIFGSDAQKQRVQALLDSFAASG